MDYKNFAVTFDTNAQEQTQKTLRSPAFKNSKIRIMPDAHAGTGCVIGFTATIQDAIIPNIVGVDIGCGMLVSSIPNKKRNLSEFDKEVRTAIPLGKKVNTEETAHCNSDFIKYRFLNSMRCGSAFSEDEIDYFARSIGTLGGGNHFIEIDEDEQGNQYLVIHTGSRNLGVQVAKYYQNLAIKKCDTNALIPAAVEIFKILHREQEIESTIKALKAAQSNIPADLAYLTGQDKEDYLNDMRLCQEYAELNRWVIYNRLLPMQLQSFESVHNYIDNDNLIRKGAIDASLGKKLIIPLNMRDGAIIGIGKGNADWNYSAPHGAGRIMSRGAARINLSLDEYQQTMNGIFTTSVSSATIDEAPMAYKPAAEIIEAIQDTVDIEHIIKPIYNIKAED